MSKKIIARSLVVLTTIGLVFAATGACNQPKPKCGTGRGTFAARYKLTAGPASCADLKGEHLGLQVYNPPGKNNNPDLDRNIVAIQSDSLGALVDNATSAKLSDPNPAHKPYALGEFTTAEPVNDFCEIPALAPAEQNLPEVPADDPADVQPATVLKYEWTNFRSYVVASAVGTQITAHLKRTQDGVACEYDVTMLYPLVDCSAPDPNDKKKSIPDVTACAPEADVDAGRPTGSGINPDFPTTCDPDLLLCVLTGDKIPALK